MLVLSPPPSSLSHVSLKELYSFDFLQQPGESSPENSPQASLSWAAEPGSGTMSPCLPAMLGEVEPAAD